MKFTYSKDEAVGEFSKAPANLKCVICQGLLKEPVITAGGGHCYCRSCIVEWFQEYDIRSAVRQKCGFEVKPLSDPMTGQPLASRALTPVQGLGDAAATLAMTNAEAFRPSTVKLDISERYQYLEQMHANSSNGSCEVFVELNACQSRIATLETQLRGMTEALQKEREHRQILELERNQLQTNLAEIHKAASLKNATPALISRSREQLQRDVKVANTEILSSHLAEIHKVAYLDNATLALVSRSREQLQRDLNVANTETEAWVQDRAGVYGKGIHPDEIKCFQVFWMSPLEIRFSHARVSDQFQGAFKGRPRVGVPILDVVEDLVKDRKKFAGSQDRYVQDFACMDVVWVVDEFGGYWAVTGSFNQHLVICRLLAILLAKAPKVPVQHGKRQCRDYKVQVRRLPSEDLPSLFQYDLGKAPTPCRGAYIEIASKKETNIPGDRFVGRDRMPNGDDIYGIQWDEADKLFAKLGCSWRPNKSSQALFDGKCRGLGPSTHLPV